MAEAGTRRAAQQTVPRFATQAWRAIRLSRIGGIQSASKNRLVSVRDLRMHAERLWSNFGGQMTAGSLSAPWRERHANGRSAARLTRARFPCDLSPALLAGWNWDEDKITGAVSLENADGRSHPRFVGQPDGHEKNTLRGSPPGKRQFGCGISQQPPFVKRRGAAKASHSTLMTP